MKRLLSLMLISVILLSMCVCTAPTGYARTPSYPRDFELVEKYSFNTGYENNETHTKRSMWYLNRAVNVGPVVNNASNGTGGFFIKGSAMGIDGSNAAYVNLPGNTYSYNGTEITVHSGYPVLFHHVLRGDHVVDAYDIFSWSAWIKNTGRSGNGDFSPLYIANADGQIVCEIKTTSNGFKFNQYTKPGETIGNSSELVIDDIFDEFDKKAWHKYGIVYDSLNKQVWYFIDDICVGYTYSPGSEIVISGQVTGVTSFPGKIEADGALYVVDDVEVRAYDYRVFNPQISLGLKNPSLVPCENDSVDFVFTVSDYEKIIDGKDVYVSFERNGEEIASIDKFKNDGTFIDDCIKKGENKYRVLLKDRHDNSILLAGDELTVTATEIKPVISFGFKDYDGVSAIEAFINETEIVFDYKSMHCEDLADSGDTLLVLYRDGEKHSEDLFDSLEGSFRVAVEEGYHSYSVSLCDSDGTELATSGVLSITGKVREYSLTLDSSVCFDGASLPTGTKVKLLWKAIDCDKLLEEANVEIFLNEDLIHTSSFHDGECAVSLKDGENKFVARISHGNTVVESRPFILLGVGDGIREPAFKIDQKHESTDIDYEQYWYVLLKQNGGVIKKANDGNEGFYMSKEGVGVDGSCAVYTSIPGSYFDKTSESANKINGSVTYYHQNRERPRMNVPENDFFVYSVMVKNTGDNTEDNFVPLRIIKSVVKNNASTAVNLAEIQANATGFKCVQYNEVGNVATYADVVYTKDAEWHKYTICYDSENKSAYYFVDDMLIAVTVDEDSKLEFFGNMCGYTRFPEKYTGNAEAVEYVVDNVYMRTYSPLFKTSLIIKVDENEEVICDGDSDVAYDNAELKLVFSQDMNTESLKNIILKVNGNTVNRVGNYDESDRSYRFDIEVEPFSEYEVDVSKALTSAGAVAREPSVFSFITKKAPLSIEDFRITGSSVHVVLNNENNYAEPVLLFAAYYSVDGKTLLKSAKMKIESVTDNNSYELNPGEKPNGSVLKVMLLGYDKLNFKDMLEK